MSSVFGSSDLLEEIVETTEEQEADFCSSGETVDECASAVTTIKEILEQQDQQLQQQQNGRLSQHQLNHSSSKSRTASTNSTLTNSSNGVVGRITTSRTHMEQEKRIRREIANSNERRRMQSINAGFQSLRSLLPHHEGEKLSKAAILQQTAEYIYQLEQQKTQLLSQNLQLKRLVDQQEGGEIPTKKRKGENQGVVVSLPVHISESGDEGLGSMSPEPLSVITMPADGHSMTSTEVAELKRQLERERHSRLLLEKQMRQLQTQLLPERFRESQLIAYQPHEVIEHTNNVTLSQEIEDSIPGMQVVSVVSVPTVGSTQTIEASNTDSNTPPLSPQADLFMPDEDVILKEELVEGSRPSTPKFIGIADMRMLCGLDDTQTNAGSFSPSSVSYANSNGLGTSGNSSSSATTATLVAKNGTVSQLITASPVREFSPDPETPALPSALEAAMKAEPKVEVERLPSSPSSGLNDCGAQGTRLYLANTSRQNLETIVEAIRHLEGDHLFSDEPAQDVPLALTTSATGGIERKPSSVAANKQRLQAEVNNFLQFHNQQQQQTQQRPGVIVVKHS